MEGDLCHSRYDNTKSDFNPLPPCGGRQDLAGALDETGSISIHSLRVEGDHNHSTESGTEQDFNPLPPCGGRLQRCKRSGFTGNFNPLPPCGGRQSGTLALLSDIPISIHSLRVEGDLLLRFRYDKFKRFQSTPSVWRETADAEQDNGNSQNFNPLPPCGGRRTLSGFKFPFAIISIHSLRVEGDLGKCRVTEMLSISIHSLRVEGDLMQSKTTAILKISIHSLRVEGDAARLDVPGRQSISIHSLRVEGDTHWLNVRDGKTDFNPLPPCGGRHRIDMPTASMAGHFNPLPPCGGRPAHVLSKHCCHFISIHSLRVEGDSESQKTALICNISIHSLRVEGDSKIAQLSA